MHLYHIHTPLRAPLGALLCVVSHAILLIISQRNSSMVLPAFAANILIFLCVSGLTNNALWVFAIFFKVG